MVNGELDVKNIIELFSCGDVRKNPETTIRIVREGKDVGVE